MTNASLPWRAQNGVVSDEDPAPKPTRRQFSAAYKLSILEEYEQLSDPGTKGALLRREGLYTSHIVEWRRAREAGSLHRTGAELGTSPQGPTSRRPSGEAHAALAKANRRAERLEAELAKTKMAREIMGKAHALL